MAGEYKRNVYLSNLDLEEAKNKLLNITQGARSYEEVYVHESLGRTTYEPIFARISAPFYNASAMDGIAVVSSDTKGADVNNPIILKKDTEFAYIDTGDPLVEPYNSVIMIEDVNELDSGDVEISKAVPTWSHVRPVGEDIVQGEMIVSSKHCITGVDIGALLAGGIQRVKVIKQLKVGIIPTGTELIEPWEEMKIGKIIDSNSRMLEALVKESGGEPNRYAPVVDQYDLIKEAIAKAIEENDIVLVNAGSSAGTEDYTSHVIGELGELLFHGISIKPGKPTMAGIIKNKCIIGIPGYPVSAFTAFEALVKPMLNQGYDEDTVIDAYLSKRVMSSLKYQEYMRIKLGQVGEKLIATPLNRGAGVTMSLVRADGVAVIPKSIEGIEASTKIPVKLLKDIETIKNTVVSIGSHDMIMDYIGELIHKKDNRYSLASSHVGSLGGIMALKRGECHIAPVHILDPETGEYNISAIKRYLGNKDITLIKGIHRNQGLMVKKDNPKGIKGLEDLTREDVIFVNRQRGSGTRILLDYCLKDSGIDSTDIQGYEREMTTHMTVASAVKSRSADIGLGIKSAAISMGLDFIPIEDECYDFIVQTEYLEQDNIKLFLEILRSYEFQKLITDIDGYSIDEAGSILYKYKRTNEDNI